MAPRLQAQAITPQRVGVHTGAQVLAFVGIDPTDRSNAVDFKWRSAVSAVGRLLILSGALIAGQCPGRHRSGSRLEPARSEVQQRLGAASTIM